MLTSAKSPLLAASLLVAVLLPLGGCSTIPGMGGGGSHAQSADTVVVVAYNIRHGRGMDDRVDLRRIAAVIEAEQPDFVTLQEVDRGTRRVDGDDQARTLGSLLGMHHAYGRFMDYDGGEYGMAVLSRWPIVNVVNERLPDGDEPRTALKVRVRSPDSGQELVIVGVHLYRTERERLAQAERLIASLADEERPVIIAGDLNSTPTDPVLDRFATEWQVLSKGRDRLTYPSDEPRTEIDYIMIRPARSFYLLEHWLLDEAVASDHRPLVAELIVRPTR